MFKKNKVSQAVFLAVSASSISVTAAAQSTIDEVVVTATKREESLQDVPIAVTALTGEALDELGITNFADYVMQLPGVTAGRQRTGSEYDLYPWCRVDYAQPDYRRRGGPGTECRFLSG